MRALDDPELAYWFQHALVQDTAYASLLKSERRQLHRGIGRALEQMYPDQLDENAARLAQHFAEAGDDFKTVEYETRAGDVASRIYANAEAIAHYTSAIEIAKRAGTADTALGNLFARRGRGLELASQFRAAHANYQEMQELAQAHGNRQMELEAIVAQCQLLCTVNSEFNPARGEEMAGMALALARELDDRAAESKILWNRLNLYRFTNRQAEAREAGERSLALARELGLSEQLALTLNDLSHVYSFEGNFERSEELLEEVIGLWRELGNLPMLADSLATASLYYSYAGAFDQAISNSEQAFQISERIGNLWGQSYSLSTVGNVYWAQGEPGRAIACMEESIRLSAPSGYIVPQIWTRAELGLVYAGLGAIELGVELARLAATKAEQYSTVLRPYVLSTLAQIYLLQGELDQAAATIELMEMSRESITLFAIAELYAKLQLALARGDFARVQAEASALLERLRALKLRPHIPDVLYLLAQAQVALGEPEAARKSLIEAQGEAQALGMRRNLGQILIALGKIDADCGNQASAQSLCEQAREVFAYIADHTPVFTPSHQRLREAFINLHKDDC